MNGETQWLPGLIAAALGLGLGLFAALRMSAVKRSQTSLKLRDQEAGWESLRAQLLEAKAAEANDPEQARHRYTLELRAAELLKDQDMTVEEAEPQPEQNATDSRRAGLVGALWGALATATILVPLYLVQTHSAERAEGGSITGNTGPAGNTSAAKPPMKGAADPALKPLRDAIAADPKASAPRLRLVRAQIGRRRFIQAYESVNALLAIDPGKRPGQNLPGNRAHRNGHGIQGHRIAQRSAR